MTETKPGSGSTATGRRDNEAKEERFSWPPSTTSVVLLMVALFCLGGPATWWAVSR